jgi:hypothetical protein
MVDAEAGIHDQLYVEMSSLLLTEVDVSIGPEDICVRFVVSVG